MCSRSARSLPTRWSKYTHATYLTRQRKKAKCMCHWRAHKARQPGNSRMRACNKARRPWNRQPQKERPHAAIVQKRLPPCIIEARVLMGVTALHAPRQARTVKRESACKHQQKAAGATRDQQQAAKKQRELRKTDRAWREKRRARPDKAHQRASSAVWRRALE